MLSLSFNIPKCVNWHICDPWYRQSAEFTFTFVTNVNVIFNRPALCRMSTATETQTGDSQNKPESTNESKEEPSTTNDKKAEESNPQLDEVKTLNEKLQKDIEDAKVIPVPPSPHSQCKDTTYNDNTRACKFTIASRICSNL